VAGGGAFFRNADRLLNRHWDYPRFLRRTAETVDFYHIVDHSYAHLLHVLPGARTGVYCHDLNTFRCLLEPDEEPRPRWFRAMAQRSLDGLRRAAIVFHNSQAVADQLLEHRLVEKERLIHAPLAPAPEFTPVADEQGTAAALVADWGDGPILLHVGSCIPRKRIDVLLTVLAAVRARRPGIRLLQVGGSWTAAQQEQLHRLGLESAVRQVQGLERTTLAGLYRRAALVLLTSEAEGFGLPVIEALACGAVVVTSDIASLREVGGTAALYAPVGDVPAWAACVTGLLDRTAAAPARAERLRQAGQFSWTDHSRIIAEAYQHLNRRIV
jgi:glycosyltransferase involved in cell wall biosynthesis